jgi:PAS domain S-box-containing protein
MFDATIPRSYSWLSVLLIVLTVLVLAIGGITFQYLETHMLETAGETLALSAAEVSDKLDNFFIERYSDVRGMAGIFSEQPLAREFQSTHVARMKTVYTDYLWIGVTNERGQIVVATDPTTVGRDYSAEPWFQAMLNGQGVHVGDVKPFAVMGGVDAVSFAAPINGPHGEFRGVVTTRVGIPWLERIMTRTLLAFQQQKGFGKSLEYQVLTEGGVAFIDSDLRYKGNVNLKQLGLPSALASEGPLSNYVEEEHLRRHVSVLTGYAKTSAHGGFEGIHWTVLIRMDRRDVLTPIREILWNLSLAGSFLVVPLFALLVWTVTLVRKEHRYAQQECVLAREAEAALRAREAHTRHIVEMALDGFIEMDAAGVITDWNVQAEQIFGWSRQEAIGRLFSATILPAQHREVHERGLRHFLATGEGPIANSRIEITGNHRDGHEMPIELTMSAILEQEGGYTFSAFVRDITIRKRAEAEQTRLVTVLDASLNEIYVFRTDTLCFTYVNRSALDNLGYTFEAMQAMTPLDIKPKMTQASFRELVNPLLTGEERQLIFETVHMRKDGSLYPVEVHLQVVTQDENQTFLAFLYDITARKRQEHRQAAEHGLTQLLLESNTLEEAVPAIMRLVCRTLEWDMGIMWKVDEEMQVLRCIDVWNEESINTAQFLEHSQKLNFAMGIGLPGRVWKSQRADWIHELACDSNFPRAALAVDAGLHAAFAFPIKCNNQVIGVMEFFVTAIREPDSQLLDMFDDFAGRLSAFLAHKETEQALHRSEARFAGILDIAEEAIISIDEAQHIILFNQGASKVFGYESSEVLGQPVDILLPSRFAQAHGRQIREFSYSQESTRSMAHRREVSGRRKSGEEFPAEASLVKVRVNDITTFTVILRDVSERRQVEQQLQQARDRAEHSAREKAQILASVEAFFICLSSVGVITEWTARAEAIFGFAPHKAIGQSFATLPISWNWEEILGALAQTGDTVQPTRLEQVRLVFPDGKEGFLKLTLSPIPDGCDDKTYIIMGEDITTRLVLERELAQAQKLESIGQLAAGIAHEINTPTQFIGDNIRFLADSFADIRTVLNRYREVLAAAKTGQWPPGLIETCDTEAQQADLDYLHEEIPKSITQTAEGIERVATIVRAMKEFAHPGSHEKVMIDLNKAIESTVIVARNEWKYVADLKINLDPSLPLVPCLVGEFNQVVLNMIVNATHAIADVVKGTTEKGTITISTQQAGDCIEVRIADTGAGIPDAIRSKIFDPFFTTKEVGKGTGQGLAIARSVVVDKHQGTIMVESRMGMGSTFIIRLPVSGQPMEKAA